MDIKTDTVVFVGDGKRTNALLPFWKRLKKSRAKLKAIPIDMGPAYIYTVLEHHLGMPLIIYRISDSWGVRATQWHYIVTTSSKNS